MPGQNRKMMIIFPEATAKVARDFLNTKATIPRR